MSVVGRDPGDDLRMAVVSAMMAAVVIVTLAAAWVAICVLAIAELAQ